MNIDDLSYGEIEQLITLFGNQSNENAPDTMLGKYVIVRTYSAGVFAGILSQRLPGNRILLTNCRRLWRWHTANNGVSLSEVAVYGINQENSKICCVETSKELEPIEISPASEISRKSIEGAKDHVA